MQQSDRSFDWNTTESAPPAARRPLMLHDETLRDGLQNPSIVDPPIERKVEILHGLAAIGVDSVNVGLPGAGPRAFEDSLRLCREIADHRLPVRPSCAGRTMVRDLEPIADISQRVGLRVEAMTFIGSSPIRQYVESWNLDFVRQRSVEAISFAAREKLPVTYVTEDTTRSSPAVLTPLFRAAIEAGARRLCLCDTVGHATPDGVRNLVTFALGVIASSGEDVGLDWHGHNDRGFALQNTLSAFDAGVDRLHGCILGVGERVGNASLELIMLNLKLEGALGARDTSTLAELCRLVASAMGVPTEAHPMLAAARAPRSEAMAS